MRVKQENIWLEVMTDRLSPGSHIMISSQVFSHSARPNSVNKHYISLYGLSNSKVCLNWSLCPLFEPRNITNISVTSFHHVNYGVIQGFPALRKAITTHEKISYFFMYAWYHQSAANMSLAFCTTWSGWWMNGEAFTVLNPRLFVGIFSDYCNFQPITCW